MSRTSQDTGKIARSAGTVSVAVLCSRVLGLVREQAFAALFGAGFAVDAFVVAFRIPNLLRDLFGEGALSAAFVTVFTDYESNRGEKDTWALAGNVLVFVTVLLSLLTLVGMLFSEQVVGALVEAGFESVPGKTELTRRLAVIMFPFLVLVSLASVVMGILNSRGRFFVPALASSFFNLGSVVGGVGLAWLMPRFGQHPIVGMAFGTLIGGVLQLACQLPTLYRAGFVFVPRLDLRDPGLRRVLRLMLPAVIGLAPMQVNVLINTYFASSLAEGSLSWLSYAFRLFWLPVGLFGVAIATAAMPVLSRHAAQKDMPRLKEAYLASLVMAFCLTFPASAGLMLMGEPITRVIFQHGSFDGLDTLRTAEALSCYAVGLFAYSCVKIAVPVFYAIDKTRYPVLGSFLTMAVNVALIWLLIGRLGHRALALSISCAMILNFLFLSAMLYRRLGGYPVRPLLAGIGKVLLATLGMSVWLLLIGGLLTGAGRGLWSELLGLAVVIGSGAAVYGGLLYLLRLGELTMLVDRLRQRYCRAGS
ncbi:MAG: murein biosynthesis integral membrane protein MurJ [Thermodesulfobacteriota bacterium]